MADAATNKYRYLLATGGIVPSTTDLRMGLLKTFAGTTNVPDINFIADLEAHADFAELTASGYARVALTSEAATEVDASDWALLDSDDVTSQAISSGGTVVGGTGSSSAALLNISSGVSPWNGARPVSSS